MPANFPADPLLLEEVMGDNTVFGRVSPHQKKDMVAALQRRGHTVAMTGDGVNDVLALKEADLGIAMNSAAPATKAVARLVLLDGRFDRLPGVVAEGRRVIANIERVSKLFLSKTAYSIAIAVSFGLLSLQFPFLPRQMSFTDGLTIGIPSFFLALMANTRRYRPGFLRRSLSFAIPAGLIVTCSLLGLNLYATSSRSAGASAGVAAVRIGPDPVRDRVVDPHGGLPPARCEEAGGGARDVRKLVILFNLPLAQEFFHLARPPADLLRAALVAALGGGLALGLPGHGSAARGGAGAGGVGFKCGRTPNLVVGGPRP